MKLPGFLFAGLLMVGIGGVIVSVAQEKGGLKRAPMSYSDPASGKQMYNDYCAACHGPQGRGDGPAVAYLKTPPPDLSTLAQRNGGKFPSYKVYSTLKFGTGSNAHGTPDMPVWGPLFQKQDRDDNQTALRISNLNAYLESLQKSK